MKILESKMSFVVIPDISYFKLNEFSDLTLYLKTTSSDAIQAEYHVHKTYLARLSPIFNKALKDPSIHELELIVPEAYIDNHREIIEFIYSLGERKVSATTKDIIKVYYSNLEFTDDYLDQAVVEDKVLNENWRDRAAPSLRSVSQSNARVLPSFSSVTSSDYDA